MRKFYATVALMLGLVMSSYAQYAENAPASEQPRHEVRVNLINSIFRLAPELAYEYAYKSDLSFGGRLAFGLQDERDSDIPTFSVTPLVRWNFYNNLRERGLSAKGFFVEVGLPISYYKAFKTNFSIYPDGKVVEYKGGAGLGISVGTGYRYISPNNWTVEGFLMGARNIVYPEGRPYFGTVGLSVGKKF